MVQPTNSERRDRSTESGYGGRVKQRGQEFELLLATSHRSKVRDRHRAPGTTAIDPYQVRLLVAVAPLPLALVHRAVGGIERLGGVLVAMEGVRPIGRRQRDLLALPEQRMRDDRRRQGVGLATRRLFVGLHQQDAELVAAETADDIGIADAVDQD